MTALRHVLARARRTVALEWTFAPDYGLMSCLLHGIYVPLCLNTQPAVTT